MDNAENAEQKETRIVMGYDEVEVNGETVKVSEFTFPQELKALTVAEPIINDIADLYIKGEDPNILVMEKCFATHSEAMTSLLSISTGKPLKWFETLSGKHVNPLFLTFWGVNSHFFTQRITSRFVMANPAMLKAKEKVSSSVKSSQH